VNIFSTLLPFASCVVSFVFAFLVFKRYLARRGPHLLLWGIGMTMYGIGGFCEAYYGMFGWNPLVFRLWYLFGALLVAAWLGQGTVYLLAKRRWADILMIVLGLASIYGAIRIFGAQLNPTQMGANELSHKAIVSGGVPWLTACLNIYGTLALVGGAAYSIYIFWRKRILLNRVIGNIFIAVGALSPAIGGTLSRLGIGGVLYISELLGAILLFIGFIRATTPMASAPTATASVATPPVEGPEK